MRPLLPLLTSLVAAPLTHAQPTLSFATHAPDNIGSYIRAEGSYVDPGPAGAGIVWDLSAAEPNGWQDTMLYLPAAQGMSPSLFPNAQHVLRLMRSMGNSDAYYEADDTGLRYRGTTDGNAWNMVMEDMMDELRFPCSYGTAWTDEAHGTSPPSWVDSLTITAEADGYGTLIAPSGTYTDVLRIHQVRRMTSRQDLGFITNTYRHAYHAYLFYAQAHRYPVMQVWTDTATIDGGAINIVRWSEWNMDNFSRIGEIRGAGERITLSPNPATERVVITGDLMTGSQVSLLDASGRVMMMTRTTQSGPFVLEVGGMERGAYVLRVTDPVAGCWGQRILLQ